MEDYLNNVVRYLQDNYFMDVHILQVGDKPPLRIDDRYTDIVFVQRINSRMLHNSSSNQSNSHAQSSTRTQTRRLYLLNTEQMSVNPYLANTLADIKRYHPYVIDYSMENIDILRRHALNTVFIHFPYPFEFRELSTKTRGVISLQTSPHRKQVCQRVAEHIGMPIEDFHGLWGDARDEKVASSLILLNLHYNNATYKIFEAIRCYGALEHGSLVISESGYNDDLVLLKDYIIFAGPDEMGETVKQVLENYESYYDQVFGDSTREKIVCLLRETYDNSIAIISGLLFNH